MTCEDVDVGIGGVSGDEDAAGVADVVDAAAGGNMDASDVDEFGPKSGAAVASTVDGGVVAVPAGVDSYRASAVVFAVNAVDDDAVSVQRAQVTI